MNDMAEYAAQIRSMHRRARRVTTGAAERAEKCRTLMRQIVALRLRRCPARIIVRRDDGELAGHDRMISPAEFGTGKMENSSLVGIEPFVSVAVGKNVLLQSQCRQIKIVDDIL